MGEKLNIQSTVKHIEPQVMMMREETTHDTGQNSRSFSSTEAYKVVTHIAWVVDRLEVTGVAGRFASCLSPAPSELCKNKKAHNSCPICGWQQ